MNLKETLNRLDGKLGKKLTEGNSNGRVDFKELKALKEEHFLKLTDGKHNIVFVLPEGANDPFSFWGIHQGLQETSYWSVPCDHENKDQECPVCKVIADLKSDDYEGNNHLWYPIRLQTEYYAPVVVVDSDETIEAGVKWLKIAKSVMTQLTEWLRNLEKDEEPFYSDDEPQKVIITYNSKAAVADKYKLDKKNGKAFTESQLKKFRANILPLESFLPSKSSTELNRILEGYFGRVATEVAVDKTDADEKSELINSKLAALKK